MIGAVSSKHTSPTSSRLQLRSAEGLKGFTHNTSANAGLPSHNDSNSIRSRKMPELNTKDGND
jgi:hypothetical protein